MLDNNKLSSKSDVIVKNKNGFWNYNTFSHIAKNGKFVAGGLEWDELIPYNEDTKYLIGTNFDYNTNYQDGDFITVLDEYNNVEAMYILKAKLDNNTIITHALRNSFYEIYCNTTFHVSNSNRRLSTKSEIKGFINCLKDCGKNYNFKKKCIEDWNLEKGEMYWTINFQYPEGFCAISKRWTNSNMELDALKKNFIFKTENKALSEIQKISNFNLDIENFKEN